ncbi:MAG: ribonuclease Y [Candidatus Roizmanbacteria bacterium]|nr:ribonuclease Y [Candidatus Roizmanbacteria bacterium]
MLQVLTKLFPQLYKTRDQILDDARAQAQEITSRARKDAVVWREKEEERLASLTKQTLELEKKVMLEKDEHKEKERQIEEKKAQIAKLQEEILLEKTSIDKKRDELVVRFEKLTHMTADEARSTLLSFWEKKLQADISRRIREAEEQIQKESEEKAKEILVQAMRYGVTDYVSEYTLSTVLLPGDDYKGRIIGKEGRNIRSFELATGVEVDLDEDGVVKLSSFDSVKREVARVSLEKLIKDGRIQPSRIEEVVKKTQEEVDKLIYKAGEKLCQDLNVYNLPTEIIGLLGRYKYRFSFGQNMIQHTLEETQIGVALAHELKADVNIVRLACLLHDIGKVINDKEGSHIQLGVDLLKRYGFPEKIINAVASHHEDTEFDSVEAVIVYLADAISGGRPGARREDVTAYIQRMQAMEDMIKKQEGVRDVYVLQAGREVRVIVNPEKLTDDETVILNDKIRDELAKHFAMIPGQLKITAIREFRTVTKTRTT